LDLRKGR